MTRHLELEGQEPEHTESVHAYELQDRQIPQDFLPLAVAYHIREANDMFVIYTPTLTQQESWRYLFEAIGTEIIEVAGQDIETLVFTARVRIEAADQDSAEDEHLLLMYANSDGAILKWVWEDRESTMVIEETVSEEEARELLADFQCPTGPS